MISDSNICGRSENIGEKQEPILFHAFRDIVDSLLKTPGINDVIHDIPHVHDVEFPVIEPIIRIRDILRVEFAFVLLPEIFYTDIRNVDATNIGSLFEIPLNKEAGPAPDIKNVFSFETCINKARFYAPLFSSIEPTVI